MRSPVCRPVLHLARMERVRRGRKKLDGENIPPDELSTAWTTADGGLSLHVPFGSIPVYPPKSGHLQCTSSCPLWTESCTAESRDGANTEKDYSLRRPECANYEVGSQAMPPKSKGRTCSARATRWHLL